MFNQLYERMLHTMLFLQDKVYVMYIAMKTFNNFDNWMKLATVCIHVPYSY